MTPEFNLIAKYFTRPDSPQSGVDLGVGDDAALLQVSAGHQLAISADMLVENTHFFADCAPYLIGWKTLAVNISDMAAMGAQPKWATLALALPTVDEVWLAEFSQGFFACADAFGVALIGGDTTRGPLTLSVQIMGEIPNGQALRRDGAQVGDQIWVTGQLGDAALALAMLLGKLPVVDDTLAMCRVALEQPQPQVALGLALRGIATAAIDVSDGLVADLGHILARSGVGALLTLAAVPCSPYLQPYLSSSAGLQCLLAGGDDYALCFTAPASAHGQIIALGNDLDLQLSCIGHVTADNALRIMDDQGNPVQLTKAGYDHFA